MLSSESRSSDGSTLSVRPSATLLGCLACVICNPNSFHSFKFKLCIMIVHSLKMFISLFLCTCHDYIFSFLGVMNIEIFLSKCNDGVWQGCLVCVICNFNSFLSFTFKLCKLIVHTLKMCTRDAGPELSLGLVLL